MVSSLLRTAALSLLLATSRLAAAPLLSADVNIFIGSKDDGNTLPRTSAPFGMIRVSPNGAHYAGWRYGEPQIRGFGRQCRPSTRESRPSGYLFR